MKKWRDKINSACGKTIYYKCQSSIFQLADWTKPYLVPVHKTSCSLHTLVRWQPVNNETIIDWSIIKPEVRRPDCKVLFLCGELFVVNGSCTEMKAEHL